MKEKYQFPRVKVVEVDAEAAVLQTDASIKPPEED